MQKKEKILLVQFDWYKKKSKIGSVEITAETA